MTDVMLVPDRGCGGCTACCHALSVDSPTLCKPNGITCPNRIDAGCAIYDARPEVCRDWYCGWRLSPSLGEEWRPDRSGFMVEILFDEKIAGFDLPPIRLTLLPPLADLRWPPFVDLVIRAIVAHQPVFLCMLGAPGHQPARTLLNVASLKAAVAAGDDDGVAAALARAAACLENHHRGARSA